MSQSPKPGSDEARAEPLFHLVPTNLNGRAALDSKNKFISEAKNGQLGFEIGYHAREGACSSHIITRIGREADIKLISASNMSMSRVHAEFQFWPINYQITLFVCSMYSSSVGCEPDSDQTLTPKELDNEHSQITCYHIEYNQGYRITIAGSTFNLVWYITDETRAKINAKQGYEKSYQENWSRPPGGRPTEFAGSIEDVWHNTRIFKGKGFVSSFKETGTRLPINRDGFSPVYKTRGLLTERGYKRMEEFAVKVIPVRNNHEGDRAQVHTEARFMREFKHVNIIEILDLKKFDTEVPEIIMPLLKGSLEDLIVEAKENDIADVQWAQICNTAAEQMLRALEYLAERKVIHRDIKPDNILYTCLDDGKVQCKLADFGLARRHGKQARGRCGTPSYQAPELYPKITKVKGDQSVKMDIYSLCGTLVTLFSKRERYPPPVEHFDPEIAVPAAMKQLQVAVGEQTMLKLMAARHPEARPSAAELLKKFYPAQRPETIDVEMEDWGVPQLKMEAPEAPEAHNIARKGVSNPTQRGSRTSQTPRGKISKTPRGARTPRAEHCMAIRTKACVAEALGI